jgi:hypothetical protein
MQENQGNSATVQEKKAEIPEERWFILSPLDDLLAVFEFVIVFILVVIFNVLIFLGYFIVFDIWIFGVPVWGLLLIPVLLVGLPFLFIYVVLVDMVIFVKWFVIFVIIF